MPAVCRRCAEDGDVWARVATPDDTGVTWDMFSPDGRPAGSGESAADAHGGGPWAADAHGGP